MFMRNVKYNLGFIGNAAIVLVAYAVLFVMIASVASFPFTFTAGLTQFATDNEGWLLAIIAVLSAIAFKAIGRHGDIKFWFKTQPDEHHE